jgi:Rrf2 family nitric oxide-sensitive transcriptional repressor
MNCLLWDIIVRLKRFSDYALRTLIFAAVKPNGLVTINEIAAAYGISKNHLMKIINMLAVAGFIETVRGRGGGLRLALPAATISVGAVLRATEADDELVECANPATNTCLITPACGLKHVLSVALEAFYAKLDGVTLADITRNKGQLNAIFSRKMPITTNRDAR